MSQFSKMDEMILIRQGKPVNCLGLTFYPIQMCHYELFLMCKSALSVRLSTLPVKYAIKDYINAIFSLEIDSSKEGREIGGIFSRIITLLKLSLRIDNFGGKSFFKDNVIFRKVNKNEIEIDRFILTQDKKTVEISALDFSTKIRSLIAKQNGIELPDENDSADLVRAQEEMNKLRRSPIKLNQSNDSLISSVAYNSRVREKEIYDWTILEFENRKNAIERDKNYMLYAQAEMSGMVTFKNGNPYPSWCYDAIDESAGTMSLSKLQQQNGNISIKE